MTYKWILPGENCADALRVRMEVFVDEQRFSAEAERDSLDNSVHHVVVYDDAGMPAATGRIYPDEEESGAMRLGRIAVVRPLRGTGLGRTLVLEMERKASELGAAKCLLGAQRQAEGFYARLGYDIYGDPYYDEHCEHVHMRKDL